MPKATHGVGSRILLHAGQQWYCGECGHQMHETLRPTRIVCTNEKCKNGRIVLLRPDISAGERVTDGTGPAT